MRTSDVLDRKIGWDGVRIKGVGVGVGAASIASPDAHEQRELD